MILLGLVGLWLMIIACSSFLEQNLPQSSASISSFCLWFHYIQVYKASSTATHGSKTDSNTGVSIYNTMSTRHERTLLEKYRYVVAQNLSVLQQQNVLTFTWVIPTNKHWTQEPAIRGLSQAERASFKNTALWSIIERAYDLARE